MIAPIALCLGPMSTGQGTTGAVVLADMRRRRTRHRLGALDWFEVAYRVYLFGLFGGGTILWISSSVKDATVATGTLADVSRHGPAVLGLLAALAVSAGLRGGSHGGPLALEAADVTHVMLAPDRPPPRPDAPLSAKGAQCPVRRGRGGRGGWSARRPPAAGVARRLGRRRCPLRSDGGPAVGGRGPRRPHHPPAPPARHRWWVSLWWPGRARQWLGASPGRPTRRAASACGGGGSTRWTSPPRWLPWPPSSPAF